jgi:hypothetical protein
MPAQLFLRKTSGGHLIRRRCEGNIHASNWKYAGRRIYEKWGLIFSCINCKPPVGITKDNRSLDSILNWPAEIDNRAPKKLKTIITPAK